MRIYKWNNYTNIPVKTIYYNLNTIVNKEYNLIKNLHIKLTNIDIVNLIIIYWIQTNSVFYWYKHTKF
jgi:hypothetical protein